MHIVVFASVVLAAVTTPDDGCKGSLSNLSLKKGATTPSGASALRCSGKCVEGVELVSIRCRRLPGGSWVCPTHEVNVPAYEVEKAKVECDEPCKECFVKYSVRKRLVTHNSRHYQPRKVPTGVSSLVLLLVCAGVVAFFIRRSRTLPQSFDNVPQQFQGDVEGYPHQPQQAQQQQGFSATNNILWPYQGVFGVTRMLFNKMRGAPQQQYAPAPYATAPVVYPTNAV
eukprot:TRINITY_DN9952_c2_g1_i1.p1 TRINITY_DN9952_c2_g1~~TRINITY_DN9952_c2_g1_i1.p1  ORF type:complete len:227 (+),score=36.37 TRINITY_DN9952_c2_g1_i1:66-746(+)